MTDRPHSVQPPRMAVWLVSLFTLAEEAEAILGDLLEEFSRIASESGADFARNWYWRQALTTVPHLLVAAYRAAPWSIGAAAAGGFLLRKFVGRIPEGAIFAVVDRYQLFEHHFKLYVFLASTGIDIGHLLSFFFVGCAVAVAAKGKEMPATVLLGLVYGAMAVVGSLTAVARSGDSLFLWRLTWYFADSFAIVIAGAIVRSFRSAAEALPVDA